MLLMTFIDIHILGLIILDNSMDMFLKKRNIQKLLVVMKYKNDFTRDNVFSYTTYQNENAILNILCYTFIIISHYHSLSTCHLDT